MSSPSLLADFSPRVRNRRNPSMLALNQHSRNALNRILKHRSIKEELIAFYARQSEGMPNIPHYLANTVYAELVKQQWLIYSKICNPTKLVKKPTPVPAAESSSSSSSVTPQMLHHRVQFHMDEDDMEFSLLSEQQPSSSSSSHNNNSHNSHKRIPSAQELEDLQALLTGDSFKTALVMQDLRLPTAWDVKAKGENISFCKDHLQLTYKGNGKDDSEVASVRANYAMRKQCGIYYFEIKVVSKGVDGHIGIGFCRRINSVDRFPGWEEHSWGYHGENGYVFSGPGTEKAYGPKFGTGDIIGCGIDFRDMSAFYTKNGIFLGTAFTKVKDTDLFPFVGFKTPGEKVEANFGARPFKFDIEQLLSNEKRELLERIALKPALTSSRFKVVNNSLANNLADNVVMEYLRHNGYHKAAKSLEHSIVQKGNTPISGESEEALDMEAMHRQEIRVAMFDGDIDKVIQLCHAYYPQVLDKNPMLLFRLRCRKFVEMMRAMQQQSSTADKDIDVPQDTDDDDDDHNALLREAQSLKVSENRDTKQPFSSKRSIDQADLDAEAKGKKKQKIASDDQTSLERVMAYGNKLRNQYTEEAKTNKAMQAELMTAFSTLAYQDLSHPAVASIYSTTQIESVASELNSAILVSLGKYPNSSLERIYRQTNVAIEELVLSGDAKAALLQPEQDCFNFLDM